MPMRSKSKKKTTLYSLWIFSKNCTGSYINIQVSTLFGVLNAFFFLLFHAKNKTKKKKQQSNYASVIGKCIWAVIIRLHLCFSVFLYQYLFLTDLILTHKIINYNFLEFGSRFTWTCGSIAETG